MPRPRSDLSHLPDGLRQAMTRMEELTEGRWDDVDPVTKRFSIAEWTLVNLAGGFYDCGLSPAFRYWIVTQPYRALTFWKYQFRYWQGMPAGPEKTKALAMCVKGLQEERKHV